MAFTSFAELARAIADDGYGRNVKLKEMATSCSSNDMASAGIIEIVRTINVIRQSVAWDEMERIKFAMIEDINSQVKAVLEAAETTEEESPEWGEFMRKTVRHDIGFRMMSRHWLLQESMKCLRVDEVPPKNTPARRERDAAIRRMRKKSKSAQS